MRHEVTNAEGAKKYEYTRGARADAEMPAVHLARFLYRMLNRPLDYIALRTIYERAAIDDGEEEEATPTAAAAAASQATPTQTQRGTQRGAASQPARRR